jgi:FkbH-like protein
MFGPHDLDDAVQGSYTLLGVPRTVHLGLTGGVITLGMLNLDSASIDDILMQRRSLKRILAAAEGLRKIKIAVLGGSTTDEIVGLWELLLLSAGFRPVFHSSEYGRFYEDAVLDPQSLIDFKPEIVYIHTSCRNIQTAPPLSCTEADFSSFVETELNRYRQIWNAIETNLGCQIIQNNFEAPPYALLGNMDASSPGGLSRFVMQLNAAFAQEAATRPRLLLQDVNGISARLGLRQWFDWDRYFSYKILLTPEANLELARSLTALVSALYGKSRKVLVLDLDNTLWGGVIGDDGVDQIQIGRETPVGEAYTAFQEYCLALRDRGVLLAVCSKNDEEIAKSGFAHPSSILKLEHISCFKANWEPKHENILAIAQELNLGVDSFVFVDDNPAERAIVAAQLPSVAVPEVGDQVTRYAAILDQGRYFEPVSLSKEDLERAAQYSGNAQRAALEKAFANYGEYLDSLEMTAEIETFKPVYLERIAQLTNKTNQFNLTTRRYTLAEIQSLATDPEYLGLYCRLSDRFGDNGLISVVLGRRFEDALHMDLWLMSCRVLKRDVEIAMLDAIAERAIASGITELVGYYLPTKKNGMVTDFYSHLGFERCISPLEYTGQANLVEGSTVWTLDLGNYTKQNKHIKLMEHGNG